ncbi:glycosyltransferase family 2 protein [Pollutibacter soli]|uniref:glycosyltransferase family 2 protein n=1 Tax=Pollutibacter soli TaxID=3034157 RepID=UPI0030135A18
MPRENPLVSVVMPVYNAGAFLVPAMKSILQQTFRDFEFIVINDGSSDNSSQIVRSFQDERIRFFEQENRGVASTLNRAIDLAKGKWIWRHDADDTCLPDKLEQQVAFLSQHQEFVMCSTQIAFMTEKGCVAKSYKQPSDNFFLGNEYIDVRRSHFRPYSPITHATVLIEKKVLEDLGGYRTFFKTAEDVDLWLRLIQKHKAAVIHRCDYFVRLNKSSATQRLGNKNEIFRNLAFRFFEQRAERQTDDLQRGVEPETDSPPLEVKQEKKAAGRNYQSDLLLYYLPLHLNAHDYRASARIAMLALREGWRDINTWKTLAILALGKKATSKIVAAKKRIAH